MMEPTQEDYTAIDHQRVCVDDGPFERPFRLTDCSPAYHIQI